MSSTLMRPFLLLFPLCFTGLLAHRQEQDKYCPDLDGRIPPELRVEPDGWLNVEGELTLEKLRGHVVWLEFSFIACGGCRMMKPILYGLQHEFGARGLAPPSALTATPVSGRRCSNQRMWYCSAGPEPKM